MHKQINYSEEISEYLLLNGFESVDLNGIHNGMLWRKHNLVVEFWQDRIQISKRDGINQYKLQNLYTGFDGHNIEHLIMLLHCSGAITIQSACKLAKEQDDQIKPIGKILMALPITETLCQR